jgi:hypothetical protein
LRGRNDLAVVLLGHARQEVGYESSGWIGLGMLLPIVSVFIFLFLVFSESPNERRLRLATGNGRLVEEIPPSLRGAVGRRTTAHGVSCVRCRNYPARCPLSRLWDRFTISPAGQPATRARYKPLLDRLFEGYQREGLTMPYTMEDFRREYIKEHLKDLTLKERLEGVSAKEVLKVLPRDEIENYVQHEKGAVSSRKRKKKK